jgi:acetyltransferase-like isoleucine patch superfamily enzyme
VLKECRIDSHSVVMPGVTICKYSVVGAYAFVNIDISDNLAMGVPARRTRKLPVYNEPK